MARYLRKTYAAPLEREYEAWVVAGMERYFKALGLEYAIWAVSPSDEVYWPADEHMFFDSKIVGLQFKQAKLAPGDVGVRKLKWSLHQPPGQFALVQRHPEVFYCLPTFIDREMRDEALHHCLFWRPCDQDDRNVWYDNPSAKTPYKRVKDSLRWGRFIEGILDCSIGRRVETREEARQFVKLVVDGVSALLSQETNLKDDGQTLDLGLYFVVVRRST